MPLYGATSRNKAYGRGGTGAAAGLYTFTSFTFTSAGVSGRSGPSLSTLQSSYSSTSWTQNTAYFTQGRSDGYQVWTVPATGTYEITAAGARGQTTASNLGYGYGCIIRARVSLTISQKLEMVIGQVPGSGAAEINSAAGYGGGGGGTYIVYQGTDTPVIVAGGGGCIYSTWSGVQRDHNGQTYRVSTWSGTIGNVSSGSYASPGQGGQGYHGGGGGGLLGSGQHYSTGVTSAISGAGGFQQYTLGAAFNGTDSSGAGWGGPWYAIGGNATGAAGAGGFGGGGGGHSGNNSGGGGGGYTGGPSGSTTVNAGSYNSGIGGGSFIISSATNVATSDGQYDGSSSFNGAITNLGAWNDASNTTGGTLGGNGGSGYVTITRIS